MNRIGTASAVVVMAGLALTACSSGTPSGGSSQSPSPSSSSMGSPSASASASSSASQSPSASASSSGSASASPTTHAAEFSATFATRTSSVTGAHGTAVFSLDHGQRHLEVSIVGLGQQAGHQLTVRVQKTRVGTLTVSSTGRLHREWSADHGQQPPAIKVGDVIRIESQSGTVLLSATFKQGHHHG